MIIIGIAGKIASGKDTSANIILKHPAKGYNTIRYGMADPLKDEVCKATGVTCEYLNAHKSHFRLILQGWGTDYRRELCGQDYWTKQFLIKIHKMGDNTVVVVPDIRFHNEAKMITELGGELWYIHRKCNDNPENKYHKSESEMDSWTRFDKMIFNFGTVKDLEEIIAKELGKTYRRFGLSFASSPSV